jgi:peptidoglycan hydrolase CwlO-like protein
MGRFVLIFLFVALSLVVNGQNYPEVVLPGHKFTVAPVNDTLWIITDNQLERAIITARKLENADKQILNYQKQIENLNEQLQQTDTLLMATQKNLEFYRKKWQECDTNIKVLVKENDRINARLKVLKIVGLVSTITAFFLGAYLL